VAIRWLEFRKGGGCNPRLLKNLWQIARKEDVIGPILHEKYGKEVERIIRSAHSVEWDQEILKNLPQLRRKDPTFDYKMACLVYYNEEISRKERDRRLDSLWILAVNKAIDNCNALRAAPKPCTWQLKEDPKLTEEMWDSIVGNWDAAVEAIVDLPTTHLKKRREAFKPFYDQEWSTWRAQLNLELFEYKRQETMYKECNKDTLQASNLRIRHWNQVWKERASKEVDQRRELGAFQGQELRMKLARARNAGAFPEDLEAIRQEIWRGADKLEQDVRRISDSWFRMDAEKKMQAKFNVDAARWFRARDSKLAAIRSRFTWEWKNLRGLQTVESKELFPFTAVSRSDCGTQVDRPDLSQAIASALASRTVPASPADCPFFRGYGHDLKIEGTRSEKSGSKDWNLLGLRGAGAIQVSSHRGPPTDRPPDKPPPAVSVVAGCSTGLDHYPVPWSVPNQAPPPG
jgi:hypothetical protein